VSETIRAIRYPFALDRGRSELMTEPEHAAHVEQMIKQVLFTAPGERANRPDFGCGVKRMVFAPLSEVSANLVHVTILDALTRWMGTVIKVEKVDVKFASEQLDITVVYTLRTTGARRYLNVGVTT